MAITKQPQSVTRLLLLLLGLAISIIIYFVVNTDQSDHRISDEALADLLVTPEPSQPPANVSPLNEEVNLRGLEPTALELTLLGVVASDSELQRSATIQSKLQVRTYFVGDQITYTNATLIEVQNDRVVILNEGMEQVLLIQGTPTSTSTQGSSADLNKEMTQEQQPKDRTIGNRPSKLKHIVTHDMDDMSISAGINPKLYRSVGFKEGDKLQKVNGIDATDFSQLTLIDNAIGNTQVVEFVVLRDGKLLSLYLDIPTKALSLSN